MAPNYISLCLLKKGIWIKSFRSLRLPRKYEISGKVWYLHNKVQSNTIELILSLAGVSEGLCWIMKMHQRRKWLLFYMDTVSVLGYMGATYKNNTQCGGCWCPGAYMAPGNQQPSWWCRPGTMFQEFSAYGLATPSPYWEMIENENKFSKINSVHVSSTYQVFPTSKKEWDLKQSVISI